MVRCGSWHSLISFINTEHLLGAAIPSPWSRIQYKRNTALWSINKHFRHSLSILNYDSTCYAATRRLGFVCFSLYLCVSICDVREFVFFSGDPRVLTHIVTTRGYRLKKKTKMYVRWSLPQRTAKAYSERSQQITQNSRWFYFKEIALNDSKILTNVARKKLLHWLS